MYNTYVLNPDPFFMQDPMNKDRRVGDHPAGSLKTMVDHLLNAVLPESVRQSTLIINDIEKRVDCQISEKMLTLVLGNILNEIVKNTHNGCIRIKASPDGETFSFGVDQGNFQFTPTFYYFIETIQVIASHLGKDFQIGVEKGPRFLLRIGFSHIGQKVA